MKEFIEWCNVNQGFLTLILSIVTITLSIIAIFVSVKTAKMPYMEKVKLTCTDDFGLMNGHLTRIPVSISITCINVGNAALGVKDVSIAYELNGKMEHLINLDGDNFDGKIISRNEYCSRTLSYDNVYHTIKNLFMENKLKKDQWLYTYAQTYSKKVYKHKLCKVDTFVSRYE